MNTRTRLAVLLGILLLVFAGGISIIQYYDLRESDNILRNRERERERLLTNLLDLTGESLKNFANDYAPWDEMLHFVSTVDPAWAAVNIDASLISFHAHAAWVLHPDGHVLYAATRGPGAGLTTPPVAPSSLLAALARERLLHFYASTPNGLIEVRAAPIVPSGGDMSHAPPAGWFLVARVWDTAYLKSLGDVLAGNVLLRPVRTTDQSPPENLDRISMNRILSGWDGRPEQVLQVKLNDDPMLLVHEHERDEILLFSVFGVLIMVLCTIALSRWVINPLRHLERSMASGSGAPLEQLRKKPDEFGRLARQTLAMLDHRAALERSVEERMTAEIALRRSNQLRTRLARDLHDSVIQSIYAAGLGLEGVRHSLRDQPQEAEARLTVALASLNQTIAEVRGFISSVEPDSEAHPAFSLTLRSLVDTLQALHPLRLQLDVAEPAAAALTPPEELQTLQIIRECVSNALRHSLANSINLSLQLRHDDICLSVTDDGQGFDPTAVAGRGRGLGNITSRAREVGAHCVIDSSPGKGTRVTVTFPRAGNYPRTNGSGA